jgi:predicted nucleic acid-binding protein
MSNSAVCIDTSVVVDRLLHPRDAKLGRLWHDWKMHSRLLIAPQLLYYETTNVIYQKLRSGYIIGDEVRKLLRLLLALPIQTFNQISLHEEALLIAKELDLGATYDAHYLALALHEGAEFFTRDARFARAAQKQYDWVQLI